MNMLETHDKALKGIQVPYHKFLLTYKKMKNHVYGFVEGKDDPAFYKGLINQMLPSDWSVELFVAGNKKNVIKIHSTINWNYYPKKQIAFFVDRDLSIFIDENIPKQPNIYMTDNYSIENDIINRATCDRILVEICRLSGISTEDKNNILDLFDKNLNQFLEEMVPIMAWIIYWKRLDLKPQLNNIEMKHIFSVSTNGIQKNQNPKSSNSIEEYIHSQCHIELDNGVNISTIEDEFRKGNVHLRFVRGKYVFWFFIEFIKIINRDIMKLTSSITEPPNINIQLSQKNGLAIIAPRVRIHESLKIFLNTTFGSYISESKIRT